MGNRKITELEELTTLDNQDVLPVVDSSEIKTKKVTVTKLLEQTVKTDDPRLTDARTPTAHTHTASQITDLDTTVNTLISSTPPSSHTHETSQITDFATAVNSLIGSTAPSSHTHDTSQITDFDSAVNTLISGSNGSGHGTGSVTAHNDITSAGSGSIITGTERTKLNGIATGATANQTDAHLLSRANHTGTQAVSTITGLGTIAVKNLPTTTDNTTQQTINGAIATALPILP